MNSAIRFASFRRILCQSMPRNGIAMSQCRMNFSTSSDDVVAWKAQSPDVSGGHSGFQLALYRTSNIIKSVTDGSPVVKLLNIYCSADLPKFINKVSLKIAYFDMLNLIITLLFRCLMLT